MKRVLYIIFFFVCSAFGVMVQAQGDLLLSQEIFSRVNKNPAATGNTDDIDIFLHGRLQWLGVDNAPRTVVLNVTDYEDAAKSGFGFSFAYDQFGVGYHTIDAKLAYSYQIGLGDRNILSLGLAAGVYVGSHDYSANTVDDDTEREEETVLNEKARETSPDFDFGLEYSNLYCTFGLSFTHLFNGETTPFKTGRHFYLYGTGLIPLSERVDLAPTVSFMHHHFSNVVEVGLMAFVNRTLWGGVAWRPDLHHQVDPSVLVFTLGFEHKKFRFGYSFDLGLGSSSQLPSNTHEVILSYGIGKNKKKN